MTRTVRIITASGLNLYAKPSPIAAGIWAADVIAFTANPNDGREYSATIGDGDHVAFVRAGGSPLATDLARWTFDAAVGSQVRTELATELGRIDATISSRSTLTAANVWSHIVTGTTSAGTALSNLITRIIGTLAAGTHQPQTGDSFARLGAPAGESIAADIAAIEGGLTGPWTRTITVTDSVSGDPIQNATVRFFRTGETESQATNSSGVATFTVTANTWSYAIVANGYAGASGTVEVGASGDTPVAMVANPPFSASAPLCAVTLPIKDQYGQPLPATMVTLTFAGVTTGAAPAGVIMSPPPVQASDSNGIVQVNLIRLAKYTATYRIGTQTRQVSFTVPDAGTFTVSD